MQTNVPSQSVCLCRPDSNTPIGELASYISFVETTHSDEAITELGDLNHTNLSTELPNYIQEVSCPSRGTNTLDHCYIQFSDAYRAFPGALLGKSGHAVLLLIPKYKQQLICKKQKPKSIKSWMTDAIDTLKRLLRVQ